MSLRRCFIFVMLSTRPIHSSKNFFPFFIKTPIFPFINLVSSIIGNKNLFGDKDIFLSKTYIMRVCQNPLFDKIILAIDNCDRGDSHTFWCFDTSLYFFLLYRNLPFFPPKPSFLLCKVTARKIRQVPPCYLKILTGSPSPASKFPNSLPLF